MGAFEYTALDERGRQKRGLLEGDTPRQVRQQLREQGLTPLEVREVGASTDRRRRSRLFGSGIGSAELALLTRQLATLCRSGMPVEEALLAASQQTEGTRLQGILLGVRSRVVEGRALASAMGEFPHIFPQMYVATVDAGERSGHLDEVLERLADYTESRQDLQRKVQAALYYPAFLIVFAVAVVSFLMVKVVPDVVEVFQSVDARLPLLTRMMLALSSFLKSFSWLLVLLAIGGTLGLRAALRNEASRRKIHRWLLGLPVIGRLVRGVNTARFTRALSIQVGSGVPVLDAMRISAQVITNLPMRECVEEAARRVREGAAVHRALAADKLFPPITLHLIASGEASGQLDKMLERAAQDQEREAETLITAMMALLEPVMILVMAGIVLVIVLAILLPIFDLNQLVK
ncbi:MAG TPA: type II secretion system inner membrane protein GspF [Nevskiales bacterium]|nr:type II secretion system inner membrane protein GspF [Nevskiales bacterium]